MGATALTNGVHAALIAVFALGCTGRAPLPPPQRPLTTTPDDSFRASVPPPEPGVPLWHPPQVQERILSNGMVIRVVESRDRQLVSMSYVNRAASSMSGAKPGLAVLVGDALLEGTRMADGQEAAGLTVAGRAPWVTTSYTGTEVGIDVVTPVAPFALTMLARIVRHPVFGEDPVSTAKALQYAALYDRSTKVSGLAWDLKVAGLYGQDHPWAVDGPTAQQALGELTHEHVRRYYDARYVPNVSALIVVGDVSASDIFAQAESLFGDWPRGQASFPDPPLRARRGNRLIHAILAGGPQTHLSTVVPAPPPSSPRYHGFRMLSTILAGSFRSRANVAMRHGAGASYGVNAMIKEFREGGLLEVTMSVDNDFVARSIRALRQAVRDIVDKGVEPAELESARATYVASFVTASNRATVRQLAWLFRLNLPMAWLANLEAAAAAVTTADLVDIARAQLPLQTAPVIAVGNFLRTGDQLRPLGRVRYYKVSSQNEHD